MGLFRRRSKDLFTIPEQAAPAPQPPGPFRMVVADVFFIHGRGVVATGTVETGSVAVGNPVTIVREGATLCRVEVSGLEAFRRRISQAGPGDNVGLLLRDIQRGDVSAGDVLHGAARS